MSVAAGRVAVGRDVFARGEYERVSVGEGECDWCGEYRLTLFGYFWRQDDDNRPTPWRTKARRFCNVECQKAFYAGRITDA
jgi:hypothetical protein